MSAFLSFLAAQRNGILLLLLVFGAMGLLLNWLLWMFRWGRFRGSPPQADSKLRFVVADFFVKLINDFRHLLALVIVLLFAFTLFLAMLPGLRDGKIDEVKDGVQAVAAALGGLIGSIIGYYFGESAASKSRPPGANQPGPPGPPEQEEPPESAAEPIEAPPNKPTVSGK
jgi:hypothetical protein